MFVLHTGDIVVLERVCAMDGSSLHQQVVNLAPAHDFHLCSFVVLNIATPRIGLLLSFMSLVTHICLACVFFSSLSNGFDGVGVNRYYFWFFKCCDSI